MKNQHLLFFLIPMFSFSQKPIFVTSTVKSATVYAQSALISENINVLLPKGNTEIIVKNISNNLNENTIQITAPANITVLSAQITNDYISEFEIDEQNPTIKKVRDSVKLIENVLQKTTNSRNTDLKTIELLDKNQQVWGNNNGLNVTELSKMVTFYQQNRTAISNNIDENDAKIDRLNQLLQKLNDKLEFSTTQNEKSSKGKLVMQVMNDLAGNTNFDITYVTNSASWKPMYDLRVNNVVDPINLIYKAQVTQNTGVDWKKIKLSLSSGNPNQNNTPPALNSWFLQYQKPPVALRDKENSEIKLMLQGKVAGVQINNDDGYIAHAPKITIRGNRSTGDGNDALIVIDGKISSPTELGEIPSSRIKSTNILKGDAGAALYGSTGAKGVVIVTTKQGMEDYTSLQENQLNVSFDIDIPYDVISNNKAHNVDLKTLKIPASFRSFVVPRIEKETFLMADILDYSKFNLLPGEANIIFEGTYVGKTFIAANQTSDTLSLSMGRDKKVVVTREKVADKSGIKFLSSKKEQTITFDITIRNNKKELVNVTVKDQYPLSTDKEVEIELLENSNANIDAETGILNWTLNLKPTETKKLRVTYKVRYPKDKTFSNL